MRPKLLVLLVLFPPRPAAAVQPDRALELDSTNMEGRAELERVLALPTAEPTDPLNRQQAQDLLTGG